MLKFVVRRVLWTIPIILLVIFMTFWMMRAIKGSPFRKSEKAVPPAVLAKWHRDAEREPELRDIFFRIVEYRRHVLAIFDSLVGWDCQQQRVQ